MNWFRRLTNVFRPERVSRDLERELEFHVAERTDELIAAGMPAPDARRKAERQLGNRVLQKERARDFDVLAWLDTVVADVRYALRALRRSPGFAAVAILSLGLGIGANTAIFSLIDATILKSLPVRDPDELVQVGLGDAGTNFTNPLWEALRDRQSAFSGIAAYGETSFNLSPTGVARLIRGSFVSGDYFSMLGVGPQAGRVLSRGDDYRGCPPVAVLGAGFWRSEFGGSPDIVGRTILLSGQPFEIVGVAAESFHGVNIGRAIQAYVPLCAEAVVSTGGRSILDRRSTWFLQVLGRPHPGTPLATVNAHLASVAPAAYGATIPEQWGPEGQAEYAARTFDAEPARSGYSDLRESYSSALIVLMTLVGVVLLIACANIANLLLARATARQREISVRLAIGAARRRIMRQLLTESLVVAVLSAVVGVVIARQGSRALVSLLATSSSTVALDLPLDLRILGFTLGVAFIAAILFGLVPAWRAGRSDPQSTLRATARGIVSGHSKFNIGKALVVVQIGLSLALVVSAGLLVNTFRRLATQSPGFNASSVVVVSATLQRQNSSLDQQRIAYNSMLESLRSTPGIESAGMSRITPVSRVTWNNDILVDGYVASSVQDGLAFLNEVGDRFFATLGSRILAGREFDERDTHGSARVAVVNEEFAKHFFGTVNVVGREFRLADSQPLQIIGVVETAKYQSLREEPQRVAYLPWSQTDDESWQSMHFAVRTRTNMTDFVPVVTTIGAAAHPGMALRITALPQQLSDSLVRERMLAMLSGSLGTLALLLAIIGLYGIMAYNVTRRRSEIGIRMALGSARSRVVRMVVGEGGWMIALGLALGVGLALGGTRFIESMLYGVTSNDVATFVICAALLGAAGLAACVVPAWRASRVEPMNALREE